MEFWNSILTEKSWNILLELKKKPIHFILIGGWANYLWTKTQKSKDIDIILEDFESLNYIKQTYSLAKNDSLKKYEIKIEEIDIDIYIEYYSELGLPIGEIKKNISVIENIKIVKPEILLILKQTAELNRKDTVKGLKDRVDIIALLAKTEIDFRKYNELLEKHSLKYYYERLKSIIVNFSDLKYLDLNPREAKLFKIDILARIAKR